LTDSQDDDHPRPRDDSRDDDLRDDDLRSRDDPRDDDPPQDDLSPPTLQQQYHYQHRHHLTQCQTNYKFAIGLSKIRII
jgi:hypothetical protein